MKKKRGFPFKARIRAVLADAGVELPKTCTPLQAWSALCAVRRISNKSSSDASARECLRQFARREFFGGASRSAADADRIETFYKSPAWRRLAFESKRAQGRRCACCGATPNDGARIVSDHIVPIKVDWERRLDPGNIQILCNDCNLGKGSRSTDHFGSEVTTRLDLPQPVKATQEAMQ